MADNDSASKVYEGVRHMSDASTPEHGEVLSFGDPAHAPS